MTMKKLIMLVFILTPMWSIAQIPGYYNGVEGKNGEDLKAALNGIIHGHVDFSYSDAKFILNYADSDPDNPDNVILFYTKRSQSSSTYGTGSNDINREHVWAKSHGDFSDIRPMDGDAFNLHPTDASVNLQKSNYDFDECSTTGTYIEEADAYYTSTQFEPSDKAKGEVARTIFYMAVRYEGNDGELDLEVVDETGTSPHPKHGKLSTLLQWNRDFPPTNLERRRNERVYEAQNNRNPFIDNPEFADLIWNGASLSGITIGQVEMADNYPYANSSTTISAVITGNTAATLYYRIDWDAEDQVAVMSQTGNTWSGQFNLAGFSAGDLVNYKIVADQGITSEILRGTYRIPENKSLTSISDVQGTGTVSPLLNSIVTVGGIVTSNFDNTYYIQNGTAPRNGICIFDIRRGNIGDSIVVTGKVAEYEGLTELVDVSYTYVYKESEPVQPAEISISEVGEEYEGMLVKIKDVTFLEGDAYIPVNQSMTLNFTDGENSMTVYSRYNSRLGGNTVPSGTVDIVGVVSQYKGDYQMLINSISDITAGDDNEPPMLTAVVVNDASWIELSFNEKLDKTSAEIVSNYSISDGVIITDAYLYNDTKVLLLVSGLRNQNYTITVSNVSDLRGNSIAEASMNFFSEFSSVGIIEQSENKIIVFPNPASDVMNLRFQGGFLPDMVQLINMKGQLVLNQHMTELQDAFSVDISNLETGIYILHLTSGDDFYRQFVKIYR